MDKPLLLTVGGRTQQVLWEPLSEHFQLVFGNAQAGQLAGSMGLNVGIMMNAITPDMLLSAKALGIETASAALDRVAQGAFSMDSAGGKWIGPFLSELSTEALVRVLAARAFAKEAGRFCGLLVHEDVSLEPRALIEYARQEGLPVLHLPHANHFQAPATDDIHAAISADWIGAYGPYMKRWYGDGDKIELVGNPGWDYLYKAENWRTKAHARLALGLPDGLVIGYAGTWLQDTNPLGDAEHILAGARRLFRAAKQLGARVVLKLHPSGRDRAELLEELKNSGAGGVMTVENSELCCLASDVMVVHGPSNFAVGAQILGIPIVELFVPGARFPAEYGIPSTWGDELASCIQEAKGQPVHQQFLNDMNIGPGSTERAVDWIRAKT